MVDYYKIVVDALKKHKRVFYIYGLAGVAEIERETTRGLSGTDVFEKRFYISKKEFNRINNGCKADDIIKIRR